MSLLKYVTIVNQNGESSKSTKHKTTDHQEKIKEYEKNRTFYINAFLSLVEESINIE
jgi:hypothetical protein